MNTRELRIGNYVDVKGVGIVKVNGVTQHKIGWCPAPGRERYARAREVKPVALSCESLELINSHVDNKDFLYDDYESNGKFIVSFGGALLFVEYLHQLQNIYFDFYHEELAVDIAK